MKGFGAMLKKEFRETVRTKKLMIILGIFTLFGILGPFTAKITPKLYEMMADDYADQGIIIGEVTVTAMDSWAQFVKNIPMALIVLLIMLSGIYTSEYSKGTLIPLITKGLSRGSVVISKMLVMIFTWTAGILVTFGLTYFYSGFYWDNSIVKNIPFSLFCWWLFGMLMISCIVFFSSFAGSGSQVMLGMGGLYFAMIMAGMVKKVKEYLPTQLCNSLPLYKGELEMSDYTRAIVITAAATMALIVLALPLTHRRKL